MDESRKQKKPNKREFEVARDASSLYFVWERDLRIKTHTIFHRRRRFLAF